LTLIDGIYTHSIIIIDNYMLDTIHNFLTTNKVFHNVLLHGIIVLGF
jgi:hypothetical protein